MKNGTRLVLVCLLFLCMFALPLQSQQTLGSLSGTVTDSSGAVIHNATVKIHNLATGLEQTVSTHADGSFEITDLPIGLYSVAFSRDAFKTEVHSQIIVQGQSHHHRQWLLAAG
jgi:hypothetical protein